MKLFKRLLLAGFASAPLSQTSLNAMLLVREITDHLPWFKPLDIVRVAYLAQLEHAGTYNERLLDLVFEASTMGPMNSAVLKHAKRARLYAANGWQALPRDTHLSSEEQVTISNICNVARDVNSAQLVAATHRKDGAWAYRYATRPYEFGVYRGVRIELGDLHTEYRMLTSAA